MKMSQKKILIVNNIYIIQKSTKLILSHRSLKKQKL